MSQIRFDVKAKDYDKKVLDSRKNLDEVNLIEMIKKYISLGVDMRDKSKKE